jgi:hypothetical protein
MFLLAFFESVVEITNGKATVLFTELTSTEEAECIGINHELSGSGGNSADAEHLIAQHSTYKMLHGCRHGCTHL